MFRLACQEQVIVGHLAEAQIGQLNIIQGPYRTHSGEKLNIIQGAV